MKAFLDHFAAILGALTVGLLLTSFAHEYGYFWLVGTNFQTLLTTSDYFTNAVLWLPVVLFFAIWVDWMIPGGRLPVKLRWKYWLAWLGGGHGSHIVHDDSDSMAAV